MKNIIDRLCGIYFLMLLLFISQSCYYNETPVELSFAGKINDAALSDIKEYNAIGSSTKGIYFVATDNSGKSKLFYYDNQSIKEINTGNEIHSYNARFYPESNGMVLANIEYRDANNYTSNLLVLRDGKIDENLSRSFAEGTNITTAVATKDFLLVFTNPTVGGGNTKPYILPTDSNSENEYEKVTVKGGGKEIISSVVYNYKIYLMDFNGNIYKNYISKINEGLNFSSPTITKEQFPGKPSFGASIATVADRLLVITRTQGFYDIKLSGGDYIVSQVNISNEQVLSISVGKPDIAFMNVANVGTTDNSTKGFVLYMNNKSHEITSKADYATLSFTNDLPDDFELDKIAGGAFTKDALFVAINGQGIFKININK